MRSFWNLVGFEYKKIFKRKSAVIALAIAAAVICAYPFTVFIGVAYIDGEPYESHYQMMQKYRAYAWALSGRAVDETLLSEARDAYLKVFANGDERSAVVEGYQLYARPYDLIYRLMRAAYDLRDLDNIKYLTPEDIRGYYQARHNRVAAGLSPALGAAAREKLLELDSGIETPFVFTYDGGYDRLFGGIYTIGITCAFALAVCLAPLFAGEYSSRADQLILSSKLGKNKLISAKLFTATTLSLGFYLFLILITVILCMLVYGYSGAYAPFQLLIPDSVYPLTCPQAILIMAACALCGNLLIVALTLLLSSVFRSPFGVMIVISVVLFAPMMLNTTESNILLYNVYSLLPTNMMAAWGAFSHVPYNLFGLIVLPCVMIPVFAAAAGAVMLPFARRAFRNHQIG